MKRKYIVLTVIAVILILTIIGLLISKNNESIKEIYNVTDVEKRIESFLHSSEYSKMSDTEKKNACENLLKELKEKGAIENYYYSESNMVYSFEYKGGIHGAVMLKDWEEDVD